MVNEMIDEKTKKVAMALAAHDYETNGLETLVPHEDSGLYAAENWADYTKAAQAAIAAIPAPSEVSEEDLRKARDERTVSTGFIVPAKDFANAISALHDAGYRIVKGETR